MTETEMEHDRLDGKHSICAHFIAVHETSSREKRS